MTTQATLTSMAPSSEVSPTPKRTPLILKVLVMASLITLIADSLTAIMTYVNIGLGDKFIESWITSFALVALIMMPVGMTMTALITKLIGTLMPKNSEKLRNLVVGVNMAIFMESLMAFITAVNNIGISDISTFTTQWFEGFIAALPIGLTIIIVMSMTVKPKIEQFLKS